ncbi:hypothetical protein ASPTUDRAFT_47392 [Aspergillus tubingensis CBS 134.48]|uniref:Uncharacterized protein n=1 Tax=Aspergillus tubingensis (strain CBS 134.48) TaxID=767770 RepID=A0A1L9MTE7_ASPTC|nr:hypothetical protein ASPTUDRAFT_47392 [Aspergillus tubingensis CBS 134.48]
MTNTSVTRPIPATPDALRSAKSNMQLCIWTTISIVGSVRGPCACSYPWCISVLLRLAFRNQFRTDLLDHRWKNVPRHSRFNRNTDEPYPTSTKNTSR